MEKVGLVAIESCMNGYDVFLPDQISYKGLANAARTTNNYNIHCREADTFRSSNSSVMEYSDTARVESDRWR